MKLPRNINDAKLLGKVLSKYTDTYYVQVLGACIVTYILYPSIAVVVSVLLYVVELY